MSLKTTTAASNLIRLFLFAMLGLVAGFVSQAESASANTVCENNVCVLTTGDCTFAPEEDLACS